MSPQLRLKQIINVHRSLSGVRYTPLCFCPDSVPLNGQITNNEETVIETPGDEEASYSCTKTLVSNNNESAFGSNGSISDCSKWTSIGSKESFSDVDESRAWCDHVDLER